MSTVESKTKFLIDTDADRLLGRTSGELSEIILGAAAQLTENRTPEGVPIIDVCDIANATELLCSAIQQGLASGNIPEEGRRVLSALSKFCDLASGECQNAGIEDESAASD